MQFEEDAWKLDAKDFACRSKAKAKSQRREPVDSSPRTCPVGGRIWTDVEPQEYSLSDFDISMTLIHLLRHGNQQVYKKCKSKLIVNYSFCRAIQLFATEHIASGVGPSHSWVGVGPSRSRCLVFLFQFGVGPSCRVGPSFPWVGVGLLSRRRGWPFLLGVGVGPSGRGWPGPKGESPAKKGRMGRPGAQPKGKEGEEPGPILKGWARPDPRVKEG